MFFFDKINRPQQASPVSSIHSGNAQRPSYPMPQHNPQHIQGPTIMHQHHHHQHPQAQYQQYVPQQQPQQIPHAQDQMPAQMLHGSAKTTPMLYNLSKMAANQTNQHANPTVHDQQTAHNEAIRFQQQQQQLQHHHQQQQQQQALAAKAQQMSTLKDKMTAGKPDFRPNPNQANGQNANANNNNINNNNVNTNDNNSNSNNANSNAANAHASVNSNANSNSKQEQRLTHEQVNELFY